MMIRIRNLIFRDIYNSKKFLSASSAYANTYVDMALKCDDIDEFSDLLYGYDRVVFTSDEQRNIIDLVAKSKGIGFSSDGKSIYLNSCPEDFCEIKTLPNDSQEYMKELFALDKVKNKI